MSFSFFKPKPKTPQEVTKAIRESLVALDTQTVVEVKALEKALEEVEKNFSTMKHMLSGDGESDPNPDQALQLAIEICKEDVIALLIHKILTFGWQARKDLVHCWSILLRQKVDEYYCCVDYIEHHLELLDFLVVCYDNKEIALTCGAMLRECIKFPTLAKYILESASFELFFKYVDLPSFDSASDAFSTFKDLLTKHENVVSEYLSYQYDKFFDMYEKLLTSTNYVTRRQSLKLLTEFLLEPPNSRIMKRYILEIRYLKAIMMLLKVPHMFDVFYAWPWALEELSRLPVHVGPFFSLEHDTYMLILMDVINYDLEDFISATTQCESGVRQSLGDPGDPSKTIQISAFHIFKVFVANPHKSQEIKIILAKNHEKLLELLGSLTIGKGSEDEQFEEEKELIMKEIDRVARLLNRET